MNDSERMARDLDLVRKLVLRDFKDVAADVSTQRLETLLMTVLDAGRRQVRRDITFEDVLLHASDGNGGDHIYVPSRECKCQSCWLLKSSHDFMMHHPAGSIREGFRQVIERTLEAVNDRKSVP